jgi:hypothetical protein
MEIRQLKDQREKIRWDAYIAQLQAKDKNLALAMQSLVDSKFNFSLFQL